MRKWNVWASSCVSLWTCWQAAPLPAARLVLLGLPSLMCMERIGRIDSEQWPKLCMVGGRATATGASMAGIARQRLTQGAARDAASIAAANGVWLWTRALVAVCAKIGPDWLRGGRLGSAFRHSWGRPGTWKRSALEKRSD